MEIERKFLVTRLPDALERYPRERMEQAYVSVDPLIRIRRAGERYILTCKGRGLLSREEFEMEITPEAYGRLLTKADGLRIVKDRYKIPLGAYTAELDIFQAPLTPLVFAEVEFPTEAAAQAFAPPDWFGREVTYDPAYTNAALSQNGVPEEKYDPKDLKSVLAYMRNQFGEGVFEEPFRMFSLLSDFAPDLRRDGNVLRQMSDAGLLRELRQVSENGAEHERIRLTTKSRNWLIDYLMLSDEKADYFMTALQATYGLAITPPKPSAPTPAPQPVAPPKAVILASGVTGDCRWTLDSNHVLTISGRGKMEPYAKKSGSRPWWRYAERINVVVIERGVTSIGKSAFSGCRALKSVTIPESVTSIGYSAFANCYRLASVTIPDSVTCIDGWTFENCYCLTSVTIPDRVTSIGSYAFRGCSSLTSATIPLSVTSIGEYAFDDCDKLKQVRVSRRTKIAPKAFDSHTQVTRC